MKFHKRTAVLMIAAPLLLSACASTGPTTGQTSGAGADATTGTTASTARNPRDPFESFNRAMFSFNDTLDRVALKPAAKAYQTVLPSFVQTGIGNFFSNIGDVWNAANNFLQGKGTDGMSDVFRVGVNTVFGLGGVLDIATEAGMPKHQEDFGQTLGTWGVKSGPYVVLPIFGSSTLRDALATPVDIYGDPWGYVYPVSYRNTGVAIRLVDKRAAVLDAGNLIEEASLDKYVFFRDAYLQRRAAQISGDDN
ncbi:VacJ family lipoprotein [Undibacterium sp.]|jgi:phospholipid-binding lipoprotein MlaA|uniref:MlaA family lipoprotein n=1 Tax=Undibacterium sp. TaxID=1914977 RepID=UPI002C87A344|nr:VacJ family lipoprotein [Undibacterium sp.]HTD06424.1 VacJ family lipoprotein [Undibacterium sp.]